MMRSHATRRAFSIIEILLGTGLAALLLVSATAAISGMSSSVRINEQTAKARQSASATLDFMLTRIRRAKELTFQSPVAGTTDTYSQITTTDEWTWNGTSYVATKATTFSVSGEVLTITSGTVGAGTSSTVRGVKSLRFRSVPDTSDPNPAKHYSYYVDVEMTIESGNTFSASASGTGRSFTLYGSAVCRSQKYTH